MQKKFQMRWHARAGQGAKSVSEILAESAMDSGYEIQAFPQYGPEKTGAPMMTFIKISKKPILSYASVTNPDVVIVMDPTLIHSTDVISGMSKGGTVLINTNKSIKEIRSKLKFKGEILTIDAHKIAESLDMPRFINTIILGAAVKVTGFIDLNTTLARVKRLFLKKLGTERTGVNLKAVKAGYDGVKQQ